MSSSLPVVVFTSVSAMLLTGIVVILLGWRRPRAATGEGVALSAIAIFIALIVLAIAPPTGRARRVSARAGGTGAVDTGTGAAFGVILLTLFIAGLVGAA